MKVESVILVLLFYFINCSSNQKIKHYEKQSCSRHGYFATPITCPVNDASHASDGTEDDFDHFDFESEQADYALEMGHQHYQSKKIRNTLITRFSQWHFPSNHLLFDSFPIDRDPMKENYVRQVKNIIFSQVLPTPLKDKAKLVAYSEDVLGSLLDLHPLVTEAEPFVAFVAGNTFLDKSIPLAHRYGGHQFGSWSGQLGDGRAHLLGEYINRKGERWELQLKGSGKTPYSRHGDGRAVLRSSVREFLGSEAMFYLGVPTSRALSLVISEDPIWRDQFYDGNPRQEKAGVVLRLAPSWFRIGSLEILAKNGEINLLRSLLDFIIVHHFTEIDSEDNDSYLAFFSEVVKQTAYMIAKWQSVGFAHGVMNTDNFSLLSITIDYGPFGFLDAYDPEFIPNTSDDEGRYSYEKQPDVGLFNMQKLADALTPLLSMNQRKQLPTISSGYVEIYKKRFMELFKKKLGLIGTEERDEYIVAMLLKMMKDTHSDFTMTFRQLGIITMATLQSSSWDTNELWALTDLSRHKMFPDWVQMYAERQEVLSVEKDLERRKMMNSVNPNYILRTWMAQSAIEDAEKGDFTTVKKLLQILSKPFENQLEADERGYASRPPHWASDVRVSCSS
nr:protein adenylyltransferase SelO-like [Lytechinus pictus]